MRFRYLNEFVKPGQILFAGSSLMEQFPIQEFIADFDLPLTIYNRGVGGFTTSEMLACMQDCVYALRPAYIFINIGTNDLNDPACTPDVLHNRYRTILSGIREHLPQAKLFLLAYYPVNPDVADAGMKEVLKVRNNDCICRANEMVKELAAEVGAAYIDVGDDIKDEKGQLKAEYTVEGMHMYANGYKAVLDRLLPHLLTLSNKNITQNGDFNQCTQIRHNIYVLSPPILSMAAAAQLQTAL